MSKELRSSCRERTFNALAGRIIVLSAHTLLQRVADTPFSFAQESNFFWLTGITEPDWWLIMDGTRRKSWLVAPHISATHQVFDGSLSQEEASDLSGITQVVSQDEADMLLQELARKHSVVYTLGEDPHAKYYDFVQNPSSKQMWRRLERLFSRVEDCRKDLARLRAIKQPEEIAAIKKAIAITIDAFSQVRDNLQTFRYEYEVEAEFSYLFRRAGSPGHAYDPIVAAGHNGCTLHYVKNQDRLKKHDLLLIDIGASWAGYAADITRTYTVSTPTKRQQQVHDAVRRAQAEIISLIRPGLDVETYDQRVNTIMREALLSLGLMTHAEDHEAFRKYFPHAISHGLGVDVHDSLGAPRALAEGMVLTVEPGIYIPEESIGVRIEDDVLVSANGHVNLSQRLSTAA